MSVTNPELQLAIDAAKERIKVETYAPKAMKSGLQGNAQGFWSGTLMGGIKGAFGGGLISLGLIAASVSSPFIGLPLVMGVAGIGATMGGATGARIGAGSGAIAGVAAERERRDKAEQLERERERERERDSSVSAKAERSSRCLSQKPSCRKK